MAGDYVWKPDTKELQMVIRMMLGESTEVFKKTVTSSIKIDLKDVDKYELRKDIISFIEMRKEMWGLK
jgi:hypothetical protein